MQFVLEDFLSSVPGFLNESPFYSFRRSLTNFSELAEKGRRQ